MIKIESNIDNTKLGSYEIIVEVKDSNDNVSNFIFEISFVESLYQHEKISDVGFYEGLFPSTGSPKLLVIPIGFEDYEVSDTLLNKINIAFNGTNNDLSFESLNTYYYKSSYQKLNVKSDILDWYKPKHSHNYYNRLEDGGTVLLEEACEYYNTTVDFTKYDYNNDDYIDGVYIIYNVPVDYVGNSLWWAYQYSSSKNMRLDGKILYNYAFAGTDFMNDKVSLGDINSRAYIHEFGHMLGLDDLYDYNEKTGPNGGLGGSDMMDHNIGDHNPFSKMALGWVKPTIVNKSGTYNLSSFVESGNVLLIHNNFNTIYDEYLLVEFYTPTSLNRIDLPMGNNIGVRILHVDARFNYDKNGNITYNGGEYYSPYIYDNSDTEHKFMKVIEADFNNSIGKNKDFNSTDLFTPNSKVFGIYQKNYWNHQNENWNYIIEVISMNENECVINIEM
jgi:M6 family metalloprotease-like protein